jgi:hypothetical protein
MRGTQVALQAVDNLRAGQQWNALVVEYQRWHEADLEFTPQLDRQ